MHKTGHSFQVFLASLLLTAALAGCGAQTNLKSSSGGETASPSPSAAAASPANLTAQVTPAPTETPIETVEISVFGSDDELEKAVEWKASIEKGSDLELVERALAELRKDSEGSTSMWKGVHVLSTQLKDGIVTIDIHIPDEVRFGAPGELLMVETLNKTLFQFTFVKGVDILVTGEAVESMMGHVELEHPFVK